MRLTETQLAQYRDEGWCAVGRLIEPEECDVILAEFEAQPQRPIDVPGVFANGTPVD